MGSGFLKKKKEKQSMNDELIRMQQTIKETIVTGTAGNGLVKVTLSGEKSLLSLSIDPECVTKEDIEGLQDLIVAAFKDAETKLEEVNPLSSLNGKLPFGF